jgi:predicted nucleotidyltransferase
MFGLLEEDLNSIIKIISKYNDIEEAVIFGSRAKGNYKNGSDVDIALKGEKISFDTLRSISWILNEETLMPYRFDILNYNSIENQELLNHISRIGKTIYHS